MQGCWHAITALAQLFQKRSVMVHKTSIAASQITPHTASTAYKAVTTQHLQKLMQAKCSVFPALQFVCNSSIKSSVDSSASCSHIKSCPLQHCCSPTCCNITALTAPFPQLQHLLTPAELSFSFDDRFYFRFCLDQTDFW